MKKTLAVIALILSTSASFAATNEIDYCYNCKVYQQKKIVKKYVAPAPPRPIIQEQVIIQQPPPVVVNPPPVVVNPPPVVVQEQVIIQQPVPMPPPPVCYWVPDPYTFLGDVFGYDYYQVCQ